MSIDKVRYSEMINELKEMTLRDRRDWLIDFKRAAGLYRSIDEHGFVEGDRTTISLDPRLSHDQMMIYGYLCLSSYNKHDKSKMCEKLGISLQTLNRCLRALRANDFLLKEYIPVSNFSVENNSIIIDEFLLSLKINSSAKLLYSYLKGWNNDNFVSVSNAKIKEDTGMGATTVAKYIKVLEQENLIKTSLEGKVGEKKRKIKFI